MTFNSIEFVVFAVFVLSLYRHLSRKGQIWLLLSASYFFYAWWDWRFLSLLALSTAIDFSVGLRLGRTESEFVRRILLGASVVTNLGILATFKYFAFFAESASALLRDIGLDLHEPTLEVVLPVGVSFYTFQSLSYTIDVFRRKVEPCIDVTVFAVYVAYFPQLVAGPIERAHRLLPQLNGRRLLPRGEGTIAAITLILRGLFRKVVIADSVAPVVETAFENASSAGWVTLLAGILGFGIQIYGDFAGYTDIARGTSRLFGIELMRNFDQPYFARNIADFWRRWHISLSTWLRDYLYVPLGGNRGSRARTFQNIALVMLLGGLWHGAAWTFVVWGFLHGCMLIIHRWWSGSQRTAGRVQRGGLPSSLATFVFVQFSWVFFRAADFGQAVDVLSGVFTLRSGAFASEDVAVVVAALVMTVVLDTIAHFRMFPERLVRKQVAFGVASGVFLAALITASGQQAVPFVYFQF